MYFLISRREKGKNRIGGHMKLPIEFEFFYPFLNPFLDNNRPSGKHFSNLSCMFLNPNSFQQFEF